MEITANNPIETRHLEALRRFGHNPDEWVFEKQLPHFRSLYKEWDNELETMIRQHSTWSPSRFELIELIPLYHFTSEYVQTMQEMSSDTLRLPNTPFSIASDPSRTITAYIEEHSSEISKEIIHGSIRHVVWMNVGLVNLLKALSHHFVWAFLKEGGDFVRFFDETTRTINLNQIFRQLVSRLKDRRFPDYPFGDSAMNIAYPEHLSKSTKWIIPGFGSLHELDHDLQKNISILGLGLVTFIVGHEMGHIYLGHTGFHPRKRIITGLQDAQVSQSAVSEAEADYVGLVSVWDGMANQKDGGNISIDYTWVAPVFFLSTMIGLSLPVSEENANKWTFRLFILIRGLIGNLRAAGFEQERIQRIILNTPLVAGSIVEWIWQEMTSDRSNESPGWRLFEQLTKYCFQL
jgi:hypothetical protein